MAEITARTAGKRRPPKGDRIALRASQEQRELIGRASEATSTTLSDFVLRASIARAEEVLAARSDFRLPPDRWNAFIEMLDRPPVEKPRLRQLLSEPSILEQ
jgi:uncharacterized protein (DUF1778 family)